HADQRLVRLLEQLRRTPELEIFNGGMEALPGVASAVTYPALARWLLARAAQVGVEQTLDNLHQFLAASVLPYRMTLALGGITLDFSCTLTDNVTLLPWNKLPETRRKKEANAMFVELRSMSDWPTAGLVRDITMPRRNVTQMESQQGEHHLAPVDYTDLQDALLCIGLVGPVAPYEVLTWLEPPEWAPILSLAW